LVTIRVVLARIHVDLLEPCVVQMCLRLWCHCNACLQQVTSALIPCKPRCT
jgi:hypothetical protein